MQIEAVDKVLGGLSQDQLRDILWNMKVPPLWLSFISAAVLLLLPCLTHEQQLTQQNADQVRQMLLSNPQLSYALLQAQVLLGLIDASTVQVRYKEASVCWPRTLVALVISSCRRRP